LDAADVHAEYRLCDQDQAYGVFPLRIVTAPLSSNLNLHAQKGMFTLIQEESANRSSRFKRTRLDELAYRLDPPLNLVQLTLSIVQAPALLRALAVAGICASTLFPGYGGVVEALREESQLWD